MKKLFLLSSLLLTFVLMAGFTDIESSKKHKKLVGTWKYEALDAPYEFQTGEFVFERIEKKLTGYAMVATSKVEMEDILTKKNSVSFKCNVQGEDVIIDLTLKKRTFTGSATSSAGVIPLTGTKIK